MDQVSLLGNRYRLAERIAARGRLPWPAAFAIGELFEAVTGETPYHGSNPVAIATQHVSAPVPDPREHRPDLPATAADLIRRALALGALVVIALLLLAWLPRSGLFDPPAGQPERSRPASSTIAPAVGGPSPPGQATADEQGKGKANDRDKGDEDD